MSHVSDSRGAQPHFGEAHIQALSGRGAREADLEPCVARSVFSHPPS